MISRINLFYHTWTGRTTLPWGSDLDRGRTADRGTGVVGTHPVLLSLQSQTNVFTHHALFHLE